MSEKGSVVPNQSLFPYRIGKRVYKLPKDVYYMCKDSGVREKDIEGHYNRWMTMGIKSTYSIAALRAIEEKRSFVEKKK